MSAEQKQIRVNEANLYQRFTCNKLSNAFGFLVDIT